jgi:sulfate/thiosulfate transport system permease protein
VKFAAIAPEDLSVSDLPATTEVRPRSIAIRSRGLTEPPLVRLALILVTILFLGLFLAVPLAAVFVEALRAGIGAYLAAITEPYAVSALKLTLLTVVLAVPANLIFGLCAGWAIAKFTFRGKQLLTTLIDLPFAVSPVISGLVFVLLAGRQGFFGPWLAEHDVRIIFAVPGIVLATVFVSFPFTGLQTFLRITLPNIKWGVLYGVILCTARVIGEFGAVSVVSGHVRGVTNTLPLHVEVLYNEYQSQAAFAVASILTFLALITLIIKTVAERHGRV